MLINLLEFKLVEVINSNLNLLVRQIQNWLSSNVFDFIHQWSKSLICEFLYFNYEIQLHLACHQVILLLNYSIFNNFSARNLSLLNVLDRWRPLACPWWRRSWGHCGSICLCGCRWQYNIWHSIRLLKLLQLTFCHSLHSVCESMNFTLSHVVEPAVVPD